MIKKKKKAHQKRKVEGTYLNIIKVIYDKSTVSIILNGEKLKTFLLRLGARQYDHCHHFYSI